MNSSKHGQSSSSVRASRKKANPWLLAGLVALLGAGGMVSAMGYFSSQTVKTSHEIVEQWNKTLGKTGKVEEISYQSGLLHSTQQLRLTTHEGVALILENRIHHGPFPGGQNVGKALIETEIKPTDPKAAQLYEKIFPNKKPTLNTLVGFGGDYKSTLNMPAGKWQEGENSAEWQEGGGVMHWNESGVIGSSDFHFPQFTLSSSEGGVVLKDIQMSGRSQPLHTGSLLTVGDSKIRIAELGLFGKSNTTNTTVKNINILSTSSTQGDQYQIGTTYQVGEMTIGKHTLTNGKLQLTLANLPTELFEQALTMAKDAEHLTEAQQQSLEEAAFNLAKKATLQLNELSLAGKGGQLKASGDIRLDITEDENNLNAEDVINPFSLISKVVVNFKASASESLVSQLLEIMNDPTPQESIEELINNKVVVKQGDILNVEFKMKDGNIFLNGNEW